MYQHKCILLFVLLAHCNYLVVQGDDSTMIPVAETKINSTNDTKVQISTKSNSSITSKLTTTTTTPAPPIEKSAVEQEHNRYNMVNIATV